MYYVGQKVIIENEDSDHDGKEGKIIEVLRYKARVMVSTRWGLISILANNETLRLLEDSKLDWE